MKDVIYITGHKNPDSDSICAAIAYAEFKNKTQDTLAIPVRLGNVSQETQYILDYFGVEAPQFLETVKLKVEDLEMDNIAPLAPEVSLKMAWNIMRDKNLKSIPVADGNNHLLGMLSTSNITETYMDVWDSNILAKSSTSLDNILDTLSAEAQNINEERKVFPGKVVVAAMQAESLKEFISEGDIAIAGDRAEIQAELIELKVSLLIVTGGHTPSKEIIELAKKNNITVITTPHDSFTASRLIVQSLPVDYIMTKDNLVTVSTDDLVEDVKVIMSETRYSNYPVIDENNKVVGSIARFHLISTHKKKVIQVDHNERGQSVHGLEDAEVLEIIDHHRVADIQTSNPIYFRNEPLGSTSTIVAKRFFENGIRPSREAAGLLCGAIISDTLLFKSPTCTPQDIKICRRLAEIAGIVPETFAKEMFRAGTSLKGKSIDEIFNSDFKPFTIGGIKIGVAQVNTMDIEGFMPLKDEMLDYMNQKADSMGLEMIMLLLTDIINEGSQILVTGRNPEIAEEAFKVKLEDSTTFLPGVLSRKKQVVPPLTQIITTRVSK
ncbi:TPA: putative manganese-dependent inorganic diphosphatase [Clostridium perfringens]|uniref:putative manganese-dependent inorganic diphosphatase n=1 Tax=Clostridium perfringens TaxID=1502 RepID=UPI000D8F42B4|nr:putative manganese-dependent inorganic diphosphatase [Clostridium perfringens]EJT5924361.1 putative manganese-dependent inorganic diphosphatase [Clostridium perfringens]MDG6878508.1 Cobalt-dependent inorganic pyrophosphatase [Clostridium perfringens]MDG6883196.1 Cobalt-dependent inorganic pyrophosphatase [Clostridium perfringens]NGT77746.1 putative manganese-dependent inorganic diphosphatase [Clostridium perfringens]NGU52938.1 putative manganese-dependent inorganic diphosphatase [Clostridiu